MKKSIDRQLPNRLNLKWLCLIFLCISNQLFAQLNYRFHHFDIKNGLASDAPRYIQQDSLGFIWIQDAYGISRFDGYNFKVYKNDPDDSLSPDIGVGSRLLVDKNKRLWMRENLRWRGLNTNAVLLSRYDWKTDGFIKYRVDLGGAEIFRIRWPTNDELFWFSTYDGKGLFSYDAKTKEIRQFVNPHSDSSIHVKQNSFTLFMYDYDSAFLLASKRGLWLFNKRTHAFSRPRCDPRDTSEIFSLTLGGGLGIIEKGVWYATPEEMVLLDQDKFHVIRRMKYPAWGSHTLLALDGKEEVFWVGTEDRGLVKYDSKSNSWKEFTNNPYDPFSIRSNSVVDVTLDRNQNVWVSTSAQGLSVLRRQKLPFINARLERFSGNCQTFSINGRDYLFATRSDRDVEGFDAQHEILLSPISSSEGEQLKFQSVWKGSPMTGLVNAISSGNSHIWVSYFGSGLIGIPKAGLIDKLKTSSFVRYSAPTIPSDRIVGTLEEGDKMWVGTKGDGVFCFDRNSGNTIHQFTNVPGDSGSLGNMFVFSVSAGHDGSKWVMTETCVDQLRDGKFDHVYNGPGFPFDVFEASDGTAYIAATDGLYARAKGEVKFTKVHAVGNIGLVSVKEDKLGRLWLANYHSLFCFDRKENSIVEFNEEDGIDHTHSGQFSGLQTLSDGRMIASDNGGVTLFDPNSFVMDNTPTDPVLTKIEVNNKPPRVGRPRSNGEFTIEGNIVMLKQLVIDHLHNNFAIEFSAMEMVAPDRNLYKYMLSGYNDDWILTDANNRRAAYTNLDPGTYTFRIRASNHHGVWSDHERVLSIVVLPPPWRTWWAYTGYSLLAAGLLLLARRSLVQRERLKSSLALAHVEQEREHFELEKAKEVDRLKTSFFTNISHEFRTPLTLIKGPVQDVLEKYKEDPIVQAKLKLVQRNSDLLLKLINQLLDLAKLESGTLKVENIEGEVYSFIKGVAGSFESLARQKGVELKVEVPGEPRPARFDKDKVETILINLINNAIKFTPQGGMVVVAISCGELTAKAPRREGLTIRVQDTGIGIPGEHQSKIFERFHQVSEAHKEVGTGIGLALVKELVTLMEGEIGVKSEVGKGTQFTVSLPIERIKEGEVSEALFTGNQSSVISEGSLTDNGRPSEYAQVADKETGIRPPITDHRLPITDHGLPITDDRPQVLVVEDNADLRAFIIDSLGPEFHFHQAENGKQGLEIATNEIPDMIISDVMMPEMDGMEMTAKLKGDIRTSHIPLILLTAKSGEDSKLEGLSKGADDYLTKPFNKQELLLKVRNGTARMQKLREKMKSEVLSSAPTEKMLSQDEQFLNKVKETIIERMSDEQLSVESLADDIGMSRVQLYRKVSALTGMAVNELIRKLRLQRAAQLLSQNWGPVSQVAYEVGFSNLSYFSKVFKEEFGLLPSEYDSNA